MQKCTRKGSALCSNLKIFPGFYSVFVWLVLVHGFCSSIQPRLAHSMPHTVQPSVFIVFESLAVAGLLLTNHICICHVAPSAFILLGVFLNKVMKCARTKSGLSTNLQDTLLFSPSVCVTCICATAFVCLLLTFLLNGHIHTRSYER